MIDSLWVDMDDEIQRQLALQVELSLDRHEAFLVGHGLRDCRRVADVGTGSGQFLRAVAVRHPEVNFTGIDNKEHMIEAARGDELPNLEWVLADALSDVTMEVIRQSDGILMRYFVLHLPETTDSLRRILNECAPGTRLWVLDLDIDNNLCEPKDEAFTNFVELVQQFCDTIGVEIRTGERLPGILASCGFDVTEVAVEPFNNKHIAPASFSDYLMREASLYHYHLYGSRGKEELSALRNFLARRAADPAYLIQYGMVMMAAVKQHL
jgi:SAM-dependent methyltransferase